MKHTKSSISKMNLKQSLVIAGTISGIASAVGLAVAIPVYLRIQEQLKKSLSATADLSKYFSDLMKRLGVEGDDASFKKELAGGYEVVYDNGQVKVFKNDSNGGKVLMVNTNPDGSVKTAGQFEGVLGMEMLNTLDNAKRSFGNEGQAINDILSEYTDIIDNSSYEKESLITGEEEALLRARDYFIANGAITDASKQQPMLIKAFDDYCVAHGQEANKTTAEIDQDKIAAEADVNANLSNYITEVLRLIQESQDAAATDALAAQGDPNALATQTAQAQNIQKQIAAKSNQLQSIDSSTSTKITTQNDAVGEKITDKLVTDANSGTSTAAINQLVLTAHKWIPVFAATFGYVDEQTGLLTSSSTFLRDLIHKKVVDNGMSEHVFKELVENVVKMLDFKDEHGNKISDHDFEEVVEEWCGDETDVKFYREHRVAPTKKIISLIENFNNFQSQDFTDDEKIVIYQVNLKGITASDKNSYNNFMIARPGTKTFRNFQAMSLIKTENFTSPNGLSDFKKTINVSSVSAVNTLIDESIRREMVEKFLELLEFTEQHHTATESQIWNIIPRIKNANTYTELTRQLQWFNQQPYGGKYQKELLSVVKSISEKYLLNGKEITFKNNTYKNATDQISQLTDPKKWFEVLSERVEEDSFIDFDSLMNTISSNISDWKIKAPQALDDLSDESIDRKNNNDNLLFENGQNILTFYQNIQFYFENNSLMNKDAQRFFNAFEKVGQASKAATIKNTISELESIEQNAIVKKYNLKLSDFMKGNDETNLTSEALIKSKREILDAQETSNILSGVVDKMFDNKLSTIDALNIIFERIITSNKLTLAQFKAKADKIYSVFNTWASDYNILKSYFTSHDYNIDEKKRFATLIDANINSISFFDGSNVRASLGKISRSPINLPRLSDYLINLSLTSTSVPDLNDSAIYLIWNKVIDFFTKVMPLYNTTEFTILQTPIIDHFYSLVGLSTANSQKIDEQIAFANVLKQVIPNKPGEYLGWLQGKIFDKNVDIVKTTNALKLLIPKPGQTASPKITAISEDYLTKANAISKPPTPANTSVVNEIGVPYQDSFLGIGNHSTAFYKLGTTSALSTFSSAANKLALVKTYSLESNNWTASYAGTSEDWQVVFDNFYGRSFEVDNYWVFKPETGVPNGAAPFKIGQAINATLSQGYKPVNDFVSTSFLVDGDDYISATSLNDVEDAAGEKYSTIIFTSRSRKKSQVDTFSGQRLDFNNSAQKSSDAFYNGETLLWSPIRIPYDALNQTSRHILLAVQSQQDGSEKVKLLNVGNNIIQIEVANKTIPKEVNASGATNRITAVTTLSATDTEWTIALLYDDGAVKTMRITSSQGKFADSSFINFEDPVDLIKVSGTKFTSITYNETSKKLAVFHDEDATLYDFSSYGTIDDFIKQMKDFNDLIK